MHVLAFVNQKGGCGKTTAAVNLAGALAAAPRDGRRAERVLIVDLDPQGHATLASGCSAPREASLLDVLRGNAEILDAWQEAPGGVKLLPAGPDLADFEDDAVRSLEPERRLRQALEPLRDQLDWVLLDCPPRVDGVLTANALAAADTAMLVVETGAFALQGAVRAREMLLDSPYTFDLRVLATLFEQRTRIGREILVALHARFGERLFETAIRTHVRLREAAARGLPVEVLSPRSRAAADFRSLTAEVRRLLGRETAGDVLVPRRAPGKAFPAPSGAPPVEPPSTGSADWVMP